MPVFKRSGKSIFGCQLNKKEQEAMEREVRSQLAEWSRKNMMEIDAMFLWFMHEEFGFGMELHAQSVLWIPTVHGAAGKAL